MDDEVIETLVCAPITAHHVIPGSRTGECGRCQGAVWVAPSGAELLAAKPNMAILCIPCTLDIVEDQDQQAILLPPTHGQIDELKHFYGQG